MLAGSTQRCYCRNTTETKPVRWVVEVADVEKDRRKSMRATERDSGKTHRANLSENRNKSIGLYPPIQESSRAFKEGTETPTFLSGHRQGESNRWDPSTIGAILPSVTNSQSMWRGQNLWGIFGRKAEHGNRDNLPVVMSPWGGAGLRENYSSHTDDLETFRDKQKNEDLL